MDYTDYSSLVEHLRGVEAVVSVINVVSAAEAGAMAHENLIRASIEAGVKRFAPSEWAGVSSKMYEAKLKTRKLLEDLNKDKKVYIYSLRHHHRHHRGLLPPQGCIQLIAHFAD